MRARSDNSITKETNWAYNHYENRGFKGKKIWIRFLFVFNKCFADCQSMQKKKNWELHNNWNIHEKWSYNHLRHRGWWWCDHNKPDHRKRKQEFNSFCCYVYHGIQLFTLYFPKNFNLPKACSHLFDITSEYLPMINDPKCIYTHSKALLAIWYTKWIVKRVNWHNLSTNMVS